MKRSVPRPILCVDLAPAMQEIRVFASVELGGVNRGTAISHAPAGKGTNAAHVLKTIGPEPLLTALAGGTTGTMHRRGVQALGIRTAYVTTTAQTRVCVTLIERDTRRVTELIEEAALPTPQEWRTFHQKFVRLISRASVLTLSGALMPGAAATVYRDLVAIAAARQVPVIIDSQRAPLLEALACRPLLAKLNVRELENTLGTAIRTTRAITAGARELIARGAGHVLVTHGDRGAWLVDADATWHFTTPSLSVCNSIGSGDAVTAGIASGLSRNRALLEAVRLGIACGAANVLTPTPGSVKVGDVRRLLPGILCQRVSGPARE